MRFDNFSFGSIQIDGSTYEHDVVIDRGEIPKARKKHPSNSARSLGTRPFPLKKTYPGNAANSSSAVVHTADYR